LKRKLYGRVPIDLGDVLVWFSKLEMSPPELAEALSSEAQGWWHPGVADERTRLEIRSC
jgi:hypothetical protein